jgi:NhaP-type Na+/H+ or K+/H+ antiporter
LLNDASGLVFPFCCVGSADRQFSLVKASWTFVLVAGGGALIGLCSPTPSIWQIAG